MFRNRNIPRMMRRNYGLFLLSYINLGEIKITNDDITKIFENTNSEFLKTSFILSLLDFPTFDQKENNKFPLVSILRLYVFKLIKGFRTYELLTKYLLNSYPTCFFHKKRG